jgi:hypothetical protein
LAGSRTVAPAAVNSASFASRYQPNMHVAKFVADVVRLVGLRFDSEQGGVDRFGGGEVGNGVQDGLDGKGWCLWQGVLRIL